MNGTHNWRLGPPALLRAGECPAGRRSGAAARRALSSATEGPLSYFLVNLLSCRALTYFFAVHQVAINLVKK